MAKKIAFKFKSPEESPGYMLGQLTLLWQRQQKKILDPLDLTHTQFVLLAALGWLSRENDAVTQVDIANQCNFDRMMVSKVLRTLEEKKYVTRQGHDTDTRAKIIRLTKSGQELLQEALTQVETMDLAFFSVLENKLPSFNASMLKLISDNSSGS